MSRAEKPMHRYVQVKMSEKAYNLLDALASAEKIPLNQLCLRLLMTHPETDAAELSEVPRVTEIGRPRTRVAAAG